ncbi:unnamed protein product [Lepeophtheirus salmonis]|uniref:(salmon louse) hypothetical protein n=1 Tax=Lepeophtheirus salmonis TaxID=72036 RepID=A0A7R8H525_LEPSM|nr:unnamed protein product [Lepeophtheirus salmonis]CAF2870722.1 unnamed protein product [Lepeophtheirus salmonis]
MEEEYVIILSIIGLRGLPTCISQSGPRKYKLIANLKERKHETKEVSSSSSTCLEFAEDLAWTTDRNTYHTLRSRKVPIRITVFERDVKVGALVLDLRETFPLPDQTTPEDFFESKSKWSRLLGSKKDPTLNVQKKCFIFLLQMTFSLSPMASHSKNKAERRDSMSEKSILSIPSRSNPIQVFHLKIEIYFASNLHLAVNKELLDQEEEERLFFFSYNIFGEKIMTKAFTDLKDPFFNVEEAVIKVHSSFPDIVQYFTNGSPFCVCVCSKKFVLAKIYFSLVEFLGLTVENLTQKKILESSRVFSFDNSEDASLGISISLVNMENAESALENTNLSNSDGGVVSDNINLRNTEDGASENTHSSCDVFPVSESDVYSTSQIENPMNSQPNTSKDIEVSYSLSVHLETIEFDSLPARNIRLRYKYAPLIKDTVVDSFEFSIEPHTRKFVPYGICKFAFKVKPSVCLEILKNNNLVVKVLDVNKNLQVIGESVIELFNLFHSQSTSSKSKKNRNYLTCDSNDGENGNKHTPFETEKDESLCEWSRKQSALLEEQYQLQWEKHESERCSSIEAELQKFSHFQKTIQDSLENQRTLSNTLEEKDKAIHELRSRLTSESSKFTKRHKEANKQNEDLSQEREKEDNSKICVELKKRDVEISEYTDKVSELNTLLRIANSRIAGNQIVVDKHKELDTIPVKRVRCNECTSLEKDKSSSSDDISKQIQRLSREKEIILKTGEYNEDGSLIRGITKKIEALYHSLNENK